MYFLGSTCQKKGLAKYHKKFVLMYPQAFHIYVTIKFHQGRIDQSNFNFVFWSHKVAGASIPSITMAITAFWQSSERSSMEKHNHGNQSRKTVKIKNFENQCEPHFLQPRICLIIYLMVEGYIGTTGFYKQNNIKELIILALHCVFL